MNNKSRRLIVGTVAILATIIIIGVLWFSSFLKESFFQSKDDSPLEFTAEVWNTQIDERYRMVDSLLKKFSFVGLRTDEVLDIFEKQEDSLTFEIGKEGCCLNQFVQDNGLYSWRVLQIYFDENDICYYYAFTDIHD